MKVAINGEQQDVEACILDQLLKEQGYSDGPGIAVALNDAVVPRGTWSSVSIEEGDRVEVLVASQGG